MKAEVEVVIAATVAAIVGGFALVVLYEAGMYQPLEARPPQHSALGQCPDCHLIKPPDRGCGGLKHQAWVDCMDAALEEREQT